MLPLDLKQLELVAQRAAQTGQSLNSATGAALPEAEILAAQRAASSMASSGATATAAATEVVAAAGTGARLVTLAARINPYGAAATAVVDGSVAAYQEYQESKDSGRAAVKFVANSTGTGALIGATIGTYVFPIVGTAGGAGLGAMIGAGINMLSGGGLSQTIGDGAIAFLERAKEAFGPSVLLGAAIGGGIGGLPGAAVGGGGALMAKMLFAPTAANAEVAAKDEVAPRMVAGAATESSAPANDLVSAETKIADARAATAKAEADTRALQTELVRKYPDYVVATMREMYPERFAGASDPEVARAFVDGKLGPATQELMKLDAERAKVRKEEVIQHNVKTEAVEVKAALKAGESPVPSLEEFAKTASNKEREALHDQLRDPYGFIIKRNAYERMAGKSDTPVGELVRTIELSNREGKYSEESIAIASQLYPLFRGATGNRSEKMILVELERAKKDGRLEEVCAVFLDHYYPKKVDRWDRAYGNSEVFSAKTKMNDLFRDEIDGKERKRWNALFER